MQSVFNGVTTDGTPVFPTDSASKHIVKEIKSSIKQHFINEGCNDVTNLNSIFEFSLDSYSDSLKGAFTEIKNSIIVELLNNLGSKEALLKNYSNLSGYIKSSSDNFKALVDSYSRSSVVSPSKELTQIQRDYDFSINQFYSGKSVHEVKQLERQTWKSVFTEAQLNSQSGQRMRSKLNALSHRDQLVFPVNNQSYPVQSSLSGTVQNAGQTCYVSSMLQFLNASQIDSDDLDRSVAIAQQESGSDQKTIVVSLKRLVDTLRHGNHISQNDIGSFLNQLNRFIQNQGHQRPHFFQTNRQDDPHALFSKIREVFDFFLTDVSSVEVNEKTDMDRLIIPENAEENYDSLEAIDDCYRQAKQAISDGVDLARFDDWRAFQMKSYLESIDANNEPTWKSLGYIRYSTYKGGPLLIHKICYAKRIELSAVNRDELSSHSLNLDQMIRDQKVSHELGFSETIRMDILRYDVVTTPGQYRINGKNNSMIDFVAGRPGVVSLNGSNFRITSATVHSPRSTSDGGHWTALLWDSQLQGYVQYSDSSQPIIIDPNMISDLSRGFVSIELQAI
ncbi:hypothetical protein DID73_02610 [Candidatus Marinamargulisbacteria bacterium SCGC AG-343-K17]|nr:hypothetical protein DID73_02610 [Candidatus Marinamargulisbacteria bacterium SCGC AG-343-K17]